MVLMTKNRKVLIAEDDDSIARLYTIYLETQDFEVKRAANGQEAIDMIASFHPDVVLLDIMMPEKSGFDVLEELRGDNKEVPLPIIMFTALAQDSEKQKAFAYGVKAYLVKSQVVISEVAEKIDEILT